MDTKQERARARRTIVRKMHLAPFSCISGSFVCLASILDLSSVWGQDFGSFVWLASMLDLSSVWRQDVGRQKSRRRIYDDDRRRTTTTTSKSKAKPKTQTKTKTKRVQKDKDMHHAPWSNTSADPTEPTSSSDGMAPHSPRPSYPVYAACPSTYPCITSTTMTLIPPHPDMSIMCLIRMPLVSWCRVLVS